MADEMGSFRVDIEIENFARPGERRTLRSVLIDTGAMLSWVPTGILDSLGVERRRVARFRLADGAVVERPIGWVVIHVAGTNAADDVVFAEPGDPVLLGARSLEGLNLTIDPIHKRLIDAGPAPAAVGA